MFTFIEILRMTFQTGVAWDIGSASDWSCRVGNLIKPIRSTAQIWVVTRHQYGTSSAFVSQTSFGGETSGSVALNVGCFLRLKRLSKCSLRNWWGKSRGVLNDVLYREAPPKTLLYVLNTIFYTLTNGSSFHIPSLELCIHLNCCKWTVFKIWIYPAKPESVLFFHSHKLHLLAILGLFTDRNNRFPNPFIYFN